MSGRKAAATAQGALSVVLAVSVAGCGLWKRGQQVGVSDEVIRTRTEERTSPRHDARASQDGLRLEVEAWHMCDAVEVHDVRRTREYDRQSTASSLVWIGVAGLALAGTGAYFLATASDRPERVPSGSDELTEDNARLMGALFTGVGGVGISAAGIHWAVVTRDDTESEMREEQGDVVSRGVRCTEREPASGVEVWIATREGRRKIGWTESDGKLVVDLSEAVPNEVVVGTSWDRNATLGVGRNAVAEVDLGPVRRWQDDRQWADAKTGQCATPDDSGDCDGVQRYLRLFPEGKHAEEAKGLMAGAQETLKRIAEREEAERKAEAERQQRLEEERRAAAERERLEAERRREELEAQRRREEERYRRELERRRRAEQQRRDEAARKAKQARERRARRAKCKAKCRAGCQGNAECRSECIRSQCR